MLFKLPIGFVKGQLYSLLQGAVVDCYLVLEILKLLGESTFNSSKFFTYEGCAVLTIFLNFVKVMGYEVESGLHFFLFAHCFLETISSNKFLFFVLLLCLLLNLPNLIFNIFLKCTYNFLKSP